MHTRVVTEKLSTEITARLRKRSAQRPRKRRRTTTWGFAQDVLNELPLNARLYFSASRSPLRSRSDDLPLHSMLRSRSTWFFDTRSSLRSSRFSARSAPFSAPLRSHAHPQIRWLSSPCSDFRRIITVKLHLRDGRTDRLSVRLLDGV